MDPRFLFFLLLLPLVGDLVGDFLGEDTKRLALSFPSL